MKISLATLLLSVGLLGGCATFQEKQEAAVSASGFLVVPVLSQAEALPGTSVDLQIEIHNMTDHDVRVPDPKVLDLVFENVGSTEPMVCLPPFALDGDLQNPEKKISLKPGAWISAPHKFELPKEADGLFLIREYYYGTVWVVLKVTKRPNQALQHNDPSCHESCLRTPRASRGRG